MRGQFDAEFAAMKNAKSQSNNNNSSLRTNKFENNNNAAIEGTNKPTDNKPLRFQPDDYPPHTGYDDNAHPKRVSSSPTPIPPPSTTTTAPSYQEPPVTQVGINHHPRSQAIQVQTLTPGRSIGTQTNYNITQVQHLESYHKQHVGESEAQQQDKKLFKQRADEAPPANFHSPTQHKDKKKKKKNNQIKTQKKRKHQNNRF